MKWNTKPITNIDDETFEGRFNAVNFILAPNETRYLPTMVSDHLANQLARKIMEKEKEKMQELNPNALIDPMLLVDRILGKEIPTAEDPTSESFKESVDKHERDFKAWQEQQKKTELLKKKEALEIATKK